MSGGNIIRGQADNEANCGAGTSDCGFKACIRNCQLHTQLNSHCPRGKSKTS